MFCMLVTSESVKTIGVGNLCNRAALYNFELCTLDMDALCFVALLWKLYLQGLDNVPLFVLVCLVKERTDLETVPERFILLAKRIGVKE